MELSSQWKTMTNKDCESSSVSPTKPKILQMLKTESKNTGAGQMVQWLRICTDFAEFGFNCLKLQLQENSMHLQAPTHEYMWVHTHTHDLKK